MRCNECGEECGDYSQFCPHCGANLNSTFNIAPVKRGDSRTKVLAVMVVAVLLVAGAFVAFSGSDDNSDKENTTNVTNESNNTTTTVSNDTSYTYDNTVFDAPDRIETDGVKKIKVTLNENVSGNYAKFVWQVKHSGSVVGTKTKTENNMTWSLKGDEIGEYTIVVKCYYENTSSIFDEYFDFGMHDDYSMTVTFEGSITKTYSWTYDGKNVSIDLSFDYDDYAKYAGETGASISKRQGLVNGVSTYSAITDFIVVDDTLTDLEKLLSTYYTANISADTSSQGYAEFILSFVQVCFSYKYDSTSYGYDEYFAFPMETIYNGAGDCEDTSILCASIYKAAGYSAGVFVIPGHCIAAISIDNYVAGSVSSTYKNSVQQFTYTYSGKTYYGCETTLDSNEYGIGFISTSYKLDGSTLTYTYTSRGQTKTATYSLGGAEGYNLYLVS